MGKDIEDSNNLSVSTNFNLSSFEIPETSNSDDLNDFLRDQLQQMKNENESLLEKLKTQELRLEHYMKKEKTKENYERNDELTTSAQVANTKIVELSKKLREKNCEIQVLKSKCTKLESTVSDLKIEVEKNPETDKEENIRPPEPDELKKLQEKLTQTTNKWIEEKNSNLQLKNDLKRANKWLIQEVGDKFETLLALNNGNSSWRGRAQIICDLQQKNQELREKLKLAQENKETCTSPNNNNNTKHEKKIQTLSAENIELKNNYSEVKRKFDSVKARCKVLENEYRLLKTKVTSLNEVHEADQDMIANLSKQVSYYHDLKSEDSKQKEQKLKKLQQENENLKVELTKEKCISENKSRELLEKNDDILLLNKRIRSSRPTSSYMHKSENTDIKVFNKLEVERSRLLELTEVQTRRLDDERNSHLKTQHLLRAERQKCAKLEANLARNQLDSFRSGYSSKAAQKLECDLKDKLELAEENIKALTTRLEILNLEKKKDVQDFIKTLQNCNCRYK